MKLGIRTRLRQTGDAVQIAMYLQFRDALDRAAAKAFTTEIKSVGPGCRVYHPYYLRNPQRIHIGRGFERSQD